MPKTFQPAFAIPIDNGHLVVIGYIAVVWGQIDYLLDEIVAHAHAFDKKQRDQFLTDKPVGTKLSMLTKDIDRLPKEIQPDAQRFVEQLNAVLQNRNSVFHGVWGWKLERKRRAAQVAVQHSKTKNNPFRPIQLKGLAERVTECSNTGIKVWSYLGEFPYQLGVPFSWGGDGPTPDSGPPEWMRKEFGEFRKARPPWDRRR